MPEVSVIIPAYNAEQFIGETLDSVLAQTLRDIEVIVVDDGSTDSTVEVVESYVERDGRITLLRQQNSYAGVARNNGMAHASGEYLYFLDADDKIDRQMLSTMVEAARSCDADVTICRSRKFDAQTGATELIDYALRDYPMGEPLTQEQVSKTMFRSIVGWPWDKLFKSSFIAEHGLEYQPLRSTNDAYFVFVAVALAQTVYCVPKELVSHRVNNMKSTSNTRKKSWDNSLIAMKAIGQRFRDEGIYELFERTYVNWCVNFTKWNIDTLDDESALGLIAEARGILKDVPQEEDYYFLKEDYEFAQLFPMSEDELLLRATRLNQECHRAKKIYGTTAYKLGMKLVKPARFVKHKILRR